MEISGGFRSLVHSRESIRQGGKMLFADPLSRICGPTEGWHDPSLPSKVATPLRYLPEEVKEIQKIRLYAGKDTGGVSKILYQWRKRKGLLASPITSGKLPTTTEAMDALHIEVEDVNKVWSVSQPYFQW
jgi:hypothetical protein